MNLKKKILTVNFDNKIISSVIEEDIILWNGHTNFSNQNSILDYIEKNDENLRLVDHDVQIQPLGGGGGTHLKLYKSQFVNKFKNN